MIDYPSHLPASVRARVERALSEAERSFAERKRQDVQRVIHFVLEVFEVFLWELTEAVRCQRERWTPERFRQESTRFLDGLIDQAYRDKLPTTIHRRCKTALVTGDITFYDSTGEMSLRAFRARILEELGTFEFWVNYRRNIEALALAATDAQAEKSANEATPDETLTDLKKRRAKLLADYKRITGITASKPIYENRKSGIHKPQFYEWLNGRLPATSATAANFERFLRETSSPD